MKRQAIMSMCAIAVAIALQGAAPGGLAAQEEFLPRGWMDESSVIAESSPVLSDDGWGSTGGDCGACSGCGCGVCYAGGCASPWTTRVGSLLFKRESPNSTNLLLDNAQDPLLSANALSFEYEGGAELSIMHDHGSGICATEARFLFFGDWETDLQLSADSPFVATNPLTPVVGDQDITAVYWTRMFGFELNYVQPQDEHFTFIVGFRYLTVDERLSLVFRDSNTQLVNQFAFWDTDNDLFGGQIGVDLHVDHPSLPMRMNCVGKVGAYLNDARTSTVVRSAGGPFLGGVNEGDPAFVAELGLNLRYDVTCCASLYGGYNFLWIDGLALASEQTARTGSLTAANPIRLAGDTGTLMFHGATFGVEFRH